MGDLLDYDVSQKAADCLHTLIRDYNNESNISILVLFRFFFIIVNFLLHKKSFIIIKATVRCLELFN